MQKTPMAQSRLPVPLDVAARFPRSLASGRDIRPVPPSRGPSQPHTERNASVGGHEAKGIITLTKQALNVQSFSRPERGWRARSNTE
jgi:hypothetical protein